MLKGIFIQDHYRKLAPEVLKPIKAIYNNLGFFSVQT